MNKYERRTNKSKLFDAGFLTKNDNNPFTVMCKYLFYSIANILIIFREAIYKIHKGFLFTILTEIKVIFLLYLPLGRNKSYNYLS